MITNHIIMPIGIIKKSTGAGTTIRPIPPHPSADKLQPQINILTRDSETGAHPRAAVRVVEIQDNVAHLEILELETEPAWPEGRDPLEVWPESHWSGFALRQADVLQSYTAW